MQTFVTSPNLRTNTGVSVALYSMKFYIYIKQVYQAAAKNFPPRPRHNISLKQSESVFNSNSVTGVTANIRSLVLTVSTQFY